ncbi:class I SAM-dependent methyltransferase [Streptomyces sp. RB110-1]|uniref:class I SAM-dependent methyltransferase n=1 Tax=unclassified Streptomyces TaxID=2593676 RepID=UPI001900851F|nr:MULTISPECIES: class I SAM-dependent methyltransferase [unclassified Streptomyces]MBK0373078.1 class I SAM-dependent methyltransferase [Streptomyces sp. RB110-1]MBK0390554.1 class I SAM-dependent methyltransferase [Streptomyces sp. RB110-2]
MTGKAESYGQKIFSHSAENERQRLAALSDVLDPVTISVLAALPLREEPRCLELGAGTGTVAAWMAAHLPGAQVTATDLDLSLITAHRPDNVRFVHHDITSDRFPAESFDLIHGRYLLHHVPDRDRVLGEIVRWLAPGGTLVLEDPAVFPLHAARDPLYRAVCLGAVEVLAQRIGSDCVDWALDLASKAGALGLTDVTVRVTCPTVSHDNAPGRFWQLTLAHLRPGLATLPGLGSREVAEVIARISRPDFLDLGMATVTTIATGPAGPADP